MGRVRLHNRHLIELLLQLLECMTALIRDCPELGQLCRQDLDLATESRELALLCCNGMGGVPAQLSMFVFKICMLFA